MSNQIAVVTNATGTQGRSVVRALSEAGYQVRALTRDTSTAHATQLKGLKNVQLIECDVNRRDSIRTAFEGAHVVYAYSIGDYRIMTAGPDANIKSEGLSEAEQGILYADLAKEANVRLLIWSTLPDVDKNSKGVYQHMGHFQEKVVAQRHIEQLGIPHVCICPGFFFDNFDKYDTARAASDGTVELHMHAANTTDPVYPMIYAEADIGRAVALILKNVDQCKGKTLKLFDRLYSLQEVSDTITKAIGRQIKIVNVDDKVAKGSDMDEMYRYLADSKCSFYEGGDSADATLQSLGFKTTPFSTYVKEKLVTKLKA